jgi:hypothetical protein
LLVDGFFCNPKAPSIRFVIMFFYANEIRIQTVKLKSKFKFINYDIGNEV